MDTSNIILSGIYDKRTLEHALKLRLTQFSFDFRPLSSNFIQQYIFEDLISVILKDYNPERFTIYLRFQFEKDFMIKNILSSIEGKGISYIVQILSDEKEEFYKSLNSDISFCYDPDVKLGPVKKSGHLHSLTLNYAYLEEIAEKSRLNEFISNLSARGVYSIPHLIELDWNSNLSKVIIDYFNAENFVLPISPEVEVCYRNVDLKKLDERLKFFSLS